MNDNLLGMMRDLGTGVGRHMINRVATTTIVTAVVLLAATAAVFALSYAPGQDPRSGDLPRVVTTKPGASVSASGTPAVAPTTAPAASLLPVPPPATAQSPSSISGSSRSSTPKPTTTEETREPSDDHEVVTPPVHDSDGEEKPKGDSKSH